MQVQVAEIDGKRHGSTSFESESGKDLRTTVYYGIGEHYCSAQSTAATRNGIFRGLNWGLFFL